jgi:Arc/MetJ-type ribon-helix-helix transcriptional regulator
MRQILSLSLPANISRQVKTRVKARGFDSISSYIKYLVIQDSDLISENELMRTIKQSRLEHKKGQSVKADSIADLV